MNGFWAVFKRELKAYFSTPVAYVFLVIFLFFAGYLPFREGFFELRQADLNLFFQILPLLFIFMVPSTAMRLWAEERRTGSIELLLTLPITVPGGSGQVFCGVGFSGDCAGADFSAAGGCILSGGAGSRADYRGLPGVLSDGRRFSGYRVVLFGPDEESGCQFYSFCGCLRDSCLCGYAFDARIFVGYAPGQRAVGD